MNDNKILLDLLNRRDEKALSYISERYGALLRALARRITGSDQDADECVNDVLLQVWNTIPPAAPSSVSSYACMLTRRTAIDRLRHTTADKRGGGEYLASLDELAEVISDEDEADSEELRRALDDFLATLSRTDRALFIGRYFAAESLPVLARHNGLSANAAGIRLSRIRSRLKDFLMKRGFSV